MQIRSATSNDAAALRSLARDALESCCGEFLTEDQRGQLAEEWYGQEALDTLLEDEDGAVLVADRDDTVMGAAALSAPEDGSVGTIRHVHVRPEAEESVWRELLSAAESRLFERDLVRVEVLVPGANSALVEAVRAADYDQGETTITRLAGTPIDVHTYFTIVPDDQRHLVVPKHVDDETVYVAFDEGRRGGTGAFFAAYREPDRNRRYGFYCDNCGSVDTTMDTMGRIACSTCGNTAKPTQWDATSR